MFAKPLADMEAQPKQAAAMATSLRNIIDKNAAGRPVIRWRRIRPALTGRTVVRKTSGASALASSSETTTKVVHGAFNPLVFLQEQCPEDVLPLILAFAGPQKAAALYRTNRHWKNILEEEATWKVMCKELYKVRLA